MTCRAVHDVKATGERFKGELDMDGKEVARVYLHKQDMDVMLKVCSHRAKPRSQLAVISSSSGVALLSVSGLQLHKLLSRKASTHQLTNTKPQHIS